MLKRGKEVLPLVFLGVLILFSCQTFVAGASTSSVEDEIKKIVYYAQEYETGNIKFVELLLYETSSRQKLNKILGVVNLEEGGLLKEEQIISILGAPTEETKWIWSEKEQNQKILSKSVPAWNKIIFDGKKIQIRIEAWPSLFAKKGKEEIIYRLHFSTDFKKPKDSFNIEQEISKIKGLAETFGADPSKEKAESLAKASVTAEKLFESFYRQSGEKCDSLMSSIFGSENKRKDEKLFVQEIDFYQGKNFIVNARLEMCDDCQGNWINLDFWIESRGPGYKMPKEEEFAGEIRRKESDEYYKERIKAAVEKLKDSLQRGDYNSVSSIKSEIRELNNAWNDASNDVWNQVDKQFGPVQNQGNQEKQEDYWWIKQEQQKRKLEKEIRAKNYGVRKEFYFELFKDYEKSESYYQQREYEKRLVELFTTFGREKCNNNQDDNGDDKIDCADSQCGGQICGKQKIVIENNNSTEESYIDLYCIAGTCQMKESSNEAKNKSVCGNHICEEGETEGCSQDCSLCQNYEAPNCTGKIIFSGENTTNGCPLPPICIEQNSSCQIDSDCLQPLCGVSSCVENQCKVASLTECKEAECIDGEKQFSECLSGEKLVISVCESGKWVSINVSSCVALEPIEQNKSEIKENVSEVPGQKNNTSKNECVVKEDCGNANDVCSNGKCVTLPKTIDEEKENQKIKDEIEKEMQKIEKPREEIKDEKKQEVKENVREDVKGDESPDKQNINREIPQNNPAGAVIFNFIRTSLSKIGLTGFEIESGSEPSSPAPQSPMPDSNTQPNPTDSNNQPSQESNSPPLQTQPQQNLEGNSPQNQQQNNQQENPQNQNNENQRGEQDRMERKQRDQQEREDRQKRDQDERAGRDKEEKERREAECKKNCDRNCYDAKIKPCAEKCIWKACEGDKMEECNVDETKKTCENTCKAEEDIKKCADDCNKNCLSGKNFGVEFKQPEMEEQKQQQSVFKAGGMCRNSPSKTESFVFFDGWGQPFQEIQKIKNKYYENGQGGWCKDRLESLKKQRKEFESGFNNQFIAWFFEQYLANSAEDWEEHISGIFELYWQDVNTVREIAMQMDCLGMDTLSDYNLINFSYQTDYGKIEFWEELKKVKLPEIDNNEVEIITPYMKAWVFPSKEFLAYEMKKSMEKHEFPGSSEQKAERKNEEGPTAEEREMIKKDKKFMDNIKRISKKYGGSVDVSVQLKDRKKNETVFNIYVKIDEENIIKMKPMLPSELPECDMTIEIDFDKVYDLIYSSEKNMQGTRIESPPWSKKSEPIQKVKDVVNGVKMWFKMRSVLSSAEYSPPESKKDAKALINSFLPKIMESSPKDNQEKEMKSEQKNNQDSEKEVWDSKEKITGEIIFN
jgi:hypothetical protein